MFPSLKYVVSVFVLIYSTLTFAARNSLAHCVFETTGFSVIRLNFYDSKHCECTQFIQFPLPSGETIRKDTLQYYISKDQVVLRNRSVDRNTETTREQCQDFYSLGFVTSNHIMRDSIHLLSYPLVPKRSSFGLSATVADISGFWYRWGYQTVGVLRSSSILRLSGILETFQLVSGVPMMPIRSLDDVKQEYYALTGVWPDSIPIVTEETPESKWFNRNIVNGCSDTTALHVVNHTYKYDKEELHFGNDTVYYYSALKRLLHACPYRIDGARVIVSDVDKVGNADTLLYVDRVLYYAKVTQYYNVCKKKESNPLAHSTLLRQSPTAFMSVRAYVLDGADVSDEQIGKTFQSVYIPLNFHSKVSHLLKDDEDNLSQSL